MWGTSIVGFGRYRYRYDSGHQGAAALVGFSPRKAKLQQLGPHKVGKGCLYLKRLDDINLEMLHRLVDRTVRVHRGADRRASAGA